MKLTRWTPIVMGGGDYADCIIDPAGQYYRVAKVDDLLSRLRGLTCAAEAWEGDEEIIVVHGVGVVGGTLSRRDAGVVARWLPGAMVEIMELLTKGDAT